MTAETPASKNRADKMPSVFVGVGGPRQIWDDEWNGKLHGWAESMPRPEAILMFSAHWTRFPITLGARETVPVADGEPGVECQMDFARMGLIDDPETGRRRVVHALIFTAVYSRHMFVWLSFTQTLEAVVAGCEAAWRFFGGVFKVLIPDNMSAIVAQADSVNPRFTVGWLEYSQARRFVTDPARVAHPQDKGLAS